MLLCWGSTIYSMISIAIHKLHNHVFSDDIKQHDVSEWRRIWIDNIVNDKGSSKTIWLSITFSDYGSIQCNIDVIHVDRFSVRHQCRQIICIVELSFHNHRVCSLCQNRHYSLISHLPFHYHAMIIVCGIHCFISKSHSLYHIIW